MFKRIQSPAGPLFYRSSLLHDCGIPHAFSTRIGGVSPEPFDSLNLGNPNGCSIQDDYEHIWENYRLLHRAAGCREEERPCRVHQVHGKDIVWVRPGEEFDTSTKADAIISEDPSRVVSVRVADCVPILLATRDGSRVAAVHAGWRGVIAGIAPMALRQLADETPTADSGQSHLGSSAPLTRSPGNPGEGRVRVFSGSKHQENAPHPNPLPAYRAREKKPIAMAIPADCIAAIGPCIGFDAFEVGEEVLEEFRQVFGDRAPMCNAPRAKGFVDLREAVRLQLLDAGLPAERIDVTDRCTYRDRDEFYSHRRDNGVTGRMAAAIQGLK